MAPSVAVLVPVLGRPHRVRPTLESVGTTTPEARVLFLPDPGDTEEIRALKAASADFHPVKGNYAVKINAGVEVTDEPLVFTGADDLNFRHGWLDAAKVKLEPSIGVVGTNDLGNPRVIRGEHATHSLVTRKYAELGTVDERGKLLHEGYYHWKVDDELVATAKARGAWAFAADSVVEHLHPYWGKSENDATYRKGEENRRADIRRFRRRERLWT